MQLTGFDFTAMDWSSVAVDRHAGESGEALWRTQQFGDTRVRMVEYTPGYVADHWCHKGHVLLVLRGQLTTTLDNGEVVELTEGQSYQVADNAQAHRSSTESGALLFIVD
jgi:quercetin dioxygenase-like cupin family protein